MTLLADLMKARTWALHTEAERTGLVSDMLHRRLTRKAYVIYLRNLLVIYQSLEADRNALLPYPEITPYFQNNLFRTPSIELDLTHLCGAETWRDLPVLEVTQNYGAAIKAARTQNLPAFLGHVYVRYLGDLNGGQILKKILGQSLNLSDDALNFYMFPNLETPRQTSKDTGSHIYKEKTNTYAVDFRNALNAVNLSKPEQNAAVKGAIEAFKWNIQLSKAAQL